MRGYYELFVAAGGFLIGVGVYELVRRSVLAAWSFGADRRERARFERARRVAAARAVTRTDRVVAK